MLNIFEIPIYHGSFYQAVVKIIHISQREERNNCIFTATSAHGMVLSRKNPNFKSLLKNVHLNLPDGTPLVWLGKWKGFRKMERCYGPDILRKTLRKSSHTPIRHFFCGAKPGVAEKLGEICIKKYKNQNYAGSFSPPFRMLTDLEYKEIASTINSQKTDILWIGLSTPKQEYFAKEISKYLNVKCIVTVGAAFDFLTDEMTEAPFFIQRIGLEWFFRLCVEPRRLLKRYMKIVPLFIYYSFQELFSKTGK